MAISGPREVLRRPMLWAGGAVALLALVPALIWQATHGWPQLDMADRIASKGDFAGRPGFLPFQLILTGCVLSWLWIYGLVRLLRADQLRPYRFLAWAHLLLNVLFLVTGGKPYYLAGLWVALWAVGAVQVERRGPPRGWSWATAPWIYPVTWLASTPQPRARAGACLQRPQRVLVLRTTRRRGEYDDLHRAERRRRRGVPPPVLD
jgi:hypothetical protein